MALLYIGVEYGAIYNGQPRLGDAVTGAGVAGPGQVLVLVWLWGWWGHLY